MLDQIQTSSRKHIVKIRGVRHGESGISVVKSRGDSKAQKRSSPLDVRQQILSCHHWLFRESTNENRESHRWKSKKASGEIDAVKNEKLVVKGTRSARAKTQFRPRRFQNLSGIMIRFGPTNTIKLRCWTKSKVHHKHMLKIRGFTTEILESQWWKAWAIPKRKRGLPTRVLETNPELSPLAFQRINKRKHGKSQVEEQKSQW